MNCHDFQRELEDALDRHGPSAEEAARFAEHVKRCSNDSCTHAWATHLSLAAVVGPWKEAVPSVEMTDPVVSELRESTLDPAVGGGPQQIEASYRMVQKPQAPRRSWKAVSAVAAALLLMASLLILNRPGDDAVATNDVSDQPLRNPESVGRDQPDVMPREEDTPVLIGHTYASMPINATEFVTDAVVFVMPAEFRDPEDEPSRADLWAVRLEERWEPIGRELSSAFESIMRALPVTDSSST